MASRAVQRRLGLALRSRVAGDDAPERAKQIWGAEGERWFTSDDPVWRVNADASMFPGGLAALLLQSLHPLAMAGVAGHSGYKGDPWGRLQRTSHYLAVTTFGTVADAEQAIARVRSVHRRVRGTDHRGRPVRRGRPAPAELGARRRDLVVPRGLPGVRRDAAHRRGGRPRSCTRPPSPPRGSGATDLPHTVAGAARSHRWRYRPELESTPAAREATRFMLLNPPVPLVLRPGYALIAAGAVALLPDVGPAVVAPPAPRSRAGGRDARRRPSRRPWCGGGWPASRTAGQGSTRRRKSLR